MIETTKKIIVIFIDHAANIFIAKQTIFISSNTNKLNFRLIRAFTYLSQFRLDVKYRFEKKHVIFDALSRLSFDNNNINRQIDDVLNLNTYHVDMINFFCSKQGEEKIYALQNSLINMSNKFKKQIMNEYKKKKMWRILLILLKNLTKRVKQKQAASATQTKVVAISANFTSASPKKSATDANEN